MKKLLLLTSVLTLAACSSGHSSSGAPSVTPVPPPPVSTSAAASNAEITGLPSEVLVASNGGSPRIVRSMKKTTSGGVTYTSYRLDDVKLFIAENFDTPPARAYINLELNDSTGEIDAVKMMVGGAASGRVVRDTTDTTTFQGPIFEYCPNDSDNAVFRVVDNGQTFAQLTALETTNSLSGGHWNRVDERMVFETKGNAGGLNLQYADFGYFNPVYRTKYTYLEDDEEIANARNGVSRADLHGNQQDKIRTNDQFNDALASEDYQLFAGGYAIEGTTMKDTLTPENGTSYSGNALGRIYVKSGGDLAKAYTTSAATLTISANGLQTLSMPFNTHSDTADTFYDVTVTKTAGGEIDFTFDGSPSNAAYNKLAAPTSTVKDFNPGYYGINTPVEAAGTVRFRQVDGESHEWDFQGAYGMKKNP